MAKTIKVRREEAKKLRTTKAFKKESKRQFEQCLRGRLEILEGATDLARLVYGEYILTGDWDYANEIEINASLSKLKVVGEQTNG